MSFTRKTIILFFLVSLLISAFSVSAFAQLKIGYVRPSYIFGKYEPYGEAERKIKEFGKAEDDKLQKEGESLKKKYEDAQKQAALMSDEMRAAKAEELAKQRDALDRAYDELYNNESGFLVKKQGELISPIIDEINEILNRIGKEEEYDYILDAEQGGVLYANEKYDISDYILEELNKGISSQ
jgi:outer membrane protein